MAQDLSDQTLARMERELQERIRRAQRIRARMSARSARLEPPPEPVQEPGDQDTQDTFGSRILEGLRSMAGRATPGTQQESRIGSAIDALTGGPDSEGSRLVREQVERVRALPERARRGATIEGQAIAGAGVRAFNAAGDAIQSAGEIVSRGPVAAAADLANRFGREPEEGRGDQVERSLEERISEAVQADEETRERIRGVLMEFTGLPAAERLGQGAARFVRSPIETLEGIADAPISSAASTGLDAAIFAGTARSAGRAVLGADINRAIRAGAGLDAEIAARDAAAARAAASRALPAPARKALPPGPGPRPAPTDLGGVAERRRLPAAAGDQTLAATETGQVATQGQIRDAMAAGRPSTLRIELPDKANPGAPVIGPSGNERAIDPQEDVFIEPKGLFAPKKQGRHLEPGETAPEAGIAEEPDDSFNFGANAEPVSPAANERLSKADLDNLIAVESSQAGAKFRKNGLAKLQTMGLTDNTDRLTEAGRRALDRGIRSRLIAIGKFSEAQADQALDLLSEVSSVIRELETGGMGFGSGGDLDYQRFLARFNTPGEPNSFRFTLKDAREILTDVPDWFRRRYVAPGTANKTNRDLYEHEFRDEVFQSTGVLLPDDIADFMRDLVLRSPLPESIQGRTAEIMVEFGIASRKEADLIATELVGTPQGVSIGAMRRRLADPSPEVAKALGKVLSRRASILEERALEAQAAEMSGDALLSFAANGTGRAGFVEEIAGRAGITLDEAQEGITFFHSGGITGDDVLDAVTGTQGPPIVRADSRRLDRIVDAIHNIPASIMAFVGNFARNVPQVGKSMMRAGLRDARVVNQQLTAFSKALFDNDLLRQADHDAVSTLLQHGVNGKDVRFAVRAPEGVALNHFKAAKAIRKILDRQAKFEKVNLRDNYVPSINLLSRDPDRIVREFLAREDGANRGIKISNPFAGPKTLDDSPVGKNIRLEDLIVPRITIGTRSTVFAQPFRRANAIVRDSELLNNAGVRRINQGVVDQLPKEIADAALRLFQKGMSRPLNPGQIAATKVMMSRFVGKRGPIEALLDTTARQVQVAVMGASNMMRTSLGLRTKPGATPWTMERAIRASVRNTYIGTLAISTAAAVKNVLSQTLFVAIESGIGPTIFGALKAAPGAARAFPRRLIGSNFTNPAETLAGRSLGSDRDIIIDRAMVQTRRLRRIKSRLDKMAFSQFTTSEDDVLRPMALYAAMSAAKLRGVKDPGELIREGLAGVASTQFIYSFWTRSALDVAPGALGTAVRPLTTFARESTGFMLRTLGGVPKTIGEAIGAKTRGDRAGFNKAIRRLPSRARAALYLGLATGPALFYLDALASKFGLDFLDVDEDEGLAGYIRRKTGLPVHDAFEGVLGLVDKKTRTPRVPPVIDFYVKFVKYLDSFLKDDTPEGRLARDTALIDFLDSATTSNPFLPIPGRAISEAGDLVRSARAGGLQLREQALKGNVNVDGFFELDSPFAPPFSNNPLVRPFLMGGDRINPSHRESMLEILLRVGADVEPGRTERDDLRRGVSGQIELRNAESESIKAVLLEAVNRATADPNNIDTDMLNRVVGAAKRNNIDLKNLLSGDTQRQLRRLGLGGTLRFLSERDRRRNPDSDR